MEPHITSIHPLRSPAREGSINILYLFRLAKCLKNANFMQIK
jgi:hypothetical protein